jgi:hypothetical protein
MEKAEVCENPKEAYVEMKKIKYGYLRQKEISIEFVQKVAQCLVLNLAQERWA